LGYGEPDTNWRYCYTSRYGDMMELPQDFEVQVDPSKVSVTEDGKKVMRPDILNFLMLASINAQTARTRREIEKHNRTESFEGKLDSRTLDATSVMKCLSLIERWPFTPWVSAFFINRGPDAVYIRINRSEEIKIEMGETRAIDYIHAEERIEQVYYKCDEGETATVRVEAFY